MKRPASVNKLCHKAKFGHLCEYLVLLIATVVCGGGVDVKAIVLFRYIYSYMRRSIGHFFALFTKTNRFVIVALGRHVHCKVLLCAVYLIYVFRRSRSIPKFVLIDQFSSILFRTRRAF